MKCRFIEQGFCGPPPATPREHKRHTFIREVTSKLATSIDGISILLFDCAYDEITTYSASHRRLQTYHSKTTAKMKRPVLPLLLRKPHR